MEIIVAGSYDNNQQRRVDDCCVDMGQRVATLEANQSHLGDTLKEVVLELKDIVLELAKKKAVEKFVLGAGGAVFTMVGFIIEHMLRK